MNQIILNESQVLSFIDKNELSKMEEEANHARNQILNRTSLGSEFLGWVDYPLTQTIDERRRIMAAAKEIRSNSDVLIVIGIGGSARAIMRLHQAKYDINTSIYDIHLSKQRVSELANFNMDQRDIETRLILKAIPDRMTTVIPGAIIIDEIMNLIHADDYAVSLYGVREGYLFNRILKDIEMAKQ